MRSKEYVLMVHFAVIRFDGASGAHRLLGGGGQGNSAGNFRTHKTKAQKEEIS